MLFYPKCYIFLLHFFDKKNRQLKAKPTILLAPYIAICSPVIAVIIIPLYLPFVKPYIPLFCIYLRFKRVSQF